MTSRSRRTASAPRRRPSRPRLGAYRFGLAAAVLLASVLRSHRLAGQCLWSDEDITLDRISQPLASMIAGLPVEHVPVYFVLERQWTSLAGTGDWSLRWPSLAFGVLAVPLAAFIAARLAGRRAGLIAGLLAAVNPFLVWFGQEARMYTMVCFLASLALALALRAWRRRRWRWWFAVGAACALTIYTHYWGALVFAALAAWAVIDITLAAPEQRPAVTGGWALATGTALAMFVPWLPRALALPQFSGWREPQPLSRAPWAIVSSWSAGPTAGSTAQAAATALYGIALLAGAAVLARRARDPKRRRRALLALSSLLVPAAAMAGLIAFRSDYHPRYFMAVVPAFIVIVAIGAASLPRRLPAAAAGLLALGAVPGLWAMYTDPAVQKQDYRAIIGTVEDAGPSHGSALLLDGPPFGMMQRYRSEDSTVKIVNLQRSDFAGLDSEQLTAAIDERVAPFHDVWLATDGQSSGTGFSWVVAHCYPVFQQSIQDVTLGRYWRELRAGHVAVSPAQPLVRPEPVQLAIGLPEHDSDGDVLPLVLEWRAQPPADLVRQRDWSVSVRLVGAQGKVLASADRAPLMGTKPTSTWAPGESVRDRQALFIPNAAGRGPYVVEVLLYDPVSLEPIGRWRWESPT